MSKRILAVLLGVAFLLTLGSCGVKQKIEEKIAETVTEGVLEKITGGNTDIDLENGELTVKGENGEEYSFGSGEWPKDKAAGLLPEFKKGKIITVMNADKACMIMLEEVEEKDFKQYVEDLKGKGFTNDVTEYSNEMGMGYVACLNEKTKATLLYSGESKSLNIGLEITE